jgi:FMN phosphatase YigB (HAD superfamily)
LFHQPIQSSLGKGATPNMKMILFDLGNTLETVVNNQDVLLPGARETLQAIQALKDAQGKPPVLALISNFGETNATPAEIAASQQEYYAILEQLDIRSFFEPVVERVTLSTEAKAAKPSKKIFKMAINKIPGLSFPDVLFITEEKTHVTAARKLKMRAIHFKGPGQSTGEINKLTDLIPLAQKFLAA